MKDTLFGILIMVLIVLSITIVAWGLGFGS